jgi:hypothetical protein
MSERPSEIDEAWMKIVLHYKTRAAEMEERLTDEVKMLRSANTGLVLENGRLLDRLSALSSSNGETP